MVRDLKRPTAAILMCGESSVVSSVGNVGIHNCPNRGAAKGFLLKSCELARNEATWGSQRLSVIHTGCDQIVVSELCLSCVPMETPSFSRQLLLSCDLVLGPVGAGCQSLPSLPINVLLGTHVYDLSAMGPEGQR